MGGIQLYPYKHVLLSSERMMRHFPAVSYMYRNIWSHNQSLSKDKFQIFEKVPPARVKMSVYQEEGKSNMHPISQQLFYN